MKDRSPVWSFGESQLLHDPTDALDAKWWFGENVIFDEVVQKAGRTVMGHLGGGPIFVGLIMR